MKKKHIVFVSREYPPTARGGGIATYIREVAVKLTVLGMKVTVICASDDTSRQVSYVEDRVNVVRLSGGDFYIPEAEQGGFPLFKKMRFVTRFFSYRKKVREYIVRELKDVSVVEVPEYGAEALFLYKMNIPLVIRFHTPSLLDRSNAGSIPLSLDNFYVYWIGWLELFIVRRVKNISSCSESMKRWFVQEGGVDEKKIQVIYNPIDIESKHCHAIERAEEINPAKKIFFGGSLTKEKGIGDLVEAIRILRSKGIDIELGIAGKMGVFGRELAMMCEQRAWDWCKFYGKIPREELMLHFQNASIACFPSWWEAFGLVCTEAMSMGTVVLASSNSGFEEIITEGVNGFLVEPQNSKLLAEKIEKILTLSPTEKEKIVCNAQRTVKERFSSDIIITKLNDYYDSIHI